MDSLRQELLNIMRDISEDHYCAGWMSGLEYDLWKIIKEYPTGNANYGLAPVSETDIIAMSLLSETLNGWWIWDDDKGEVFVSLEKWKKIQDGKA